MHYLMGILGLLSLAIPALSIEVFRSPYLADTGGKFEAVFETGEQAVPQIISQEKGAEIAADFATNFYHIQVGTVATFQFRTKPIPYWLFGFSDPAKGHQMFWVVVLPNGAVVKPQLETVQEPAHS
jgi:hypothetical protein